VCIRAFPADWVAYFGEIADGKTAFPTGIGAASGAAAGLGAGGVAAVVFGARVGEGGAAGAGAGVTAADDPHCAFRKSFHFWPPSVPEVLAASYFALHSFIVNAAAGAVTTTIRQDIKAAVITLDFIDIAILLSKIENWD